MDVELPPWAGRIVAKIVRVWTTPIVSFRVGDDGVSIKMLPDYPGFRVSVAKSIDQRLAQIDIARANLQSALSAVDELKQMASDSKAEFDDAVTRLRQAQESQVNAEQDALLAKTLANADVGAFQRLVRIPSPWQVAVERLIGFVIGVIASLAASLLWWLFTRDS